MKKILLGICTMIMAFVYSASVTYAADIQDENTFMYEDNSSSVTYTKIIIDTENCYEGMGRAYSQGYEPEISDGRVNIMLPLICRTGELKGRELYMEVSFGDASTLPFVYRNYGKIVKEQQYMNNKNECYDIYMASVTLDLKEDRVNGSYPVIFSLSGIDERGIPVECKYTVYVNITDGENINVNMKEDEEKQENTYCDNSADNRNTDDKSVDITDSDTDNYISNNISDVVTFAPKVLVTSCKTSKEKVYAGDEFELTIKLKNTSASQAIANMTVNAQLQGEYFTLISDTDTVYIDSLGASKETELKLKYKAAPGTPQGQYNITLSMDYADLKGQGYAQSGNARFNIFQYAEVEFEDIQMVSEAKVGEKIDASVTALNLGKSKIYNVRACIECDGLEPSGTLFIGDLEQGNTGTANIRVQVGSLKGGTYGTASGKVTYYYQDESGNEYEEKRDIDFTVKTPFTEEKPEEEEKDEPYQWWSVMSFISAIILCIVVNFIFKKISNREKNE